MPVKPTDRAEAAQREIEVRDSQLRPGVKELRLAGATAAFVVPYRNAEGQAFEIRIVRTGHRRFGFSDLAAAIAAATAELRRAS